MAELFACCERRPAKLLGGRLATPGFRARRPSGTMRFVAAVGCVAMGCVSLASSASAAEKEATACQNFPSWQDSYGYKCEHYAESAYCSPDGKPGAGWEAHWGAISDWKVEGGVDATKACCACGGGMTKAQKKFAKEPMGRSRRPRAMRKEGPPGI